MQRSPIIPNAHWAETGLITLGGEITLVSQAGLGGWVLSFWLLLRPCSCSRTHNWAASESHHLSPSGLTLESSFSFALAKNDSTAVADPTVFPSSFTA
jgi:hypothetical protein